MNNTVFIGGSRHISHLSHQAKERLDKLVRNGCAVVVGDANGADKAVQKHLVEAGYEKVTVFCSGPHYRNNVGHWPTKNITPANNAKGFEFHAAKDREMAERADYGMMIWDGKSPGTILNAFRLVAANKSTVVLHEREKRTIVLKSMSDWEDFISQCSPDLISDITERATAAERAKGLNVQRELGYEVHSEALEPLSLGKPTSVRELTQIINSALISADPTVLADAIVELARKRGLPEVEQKASQLQKHLNGDRERAEFRLILSAIGSIGVRLPSSNGSKSRAKKKSITQVTSAAS